MVSFTAASAVASDFEIEPEPGGPLCKACSHGKSHHGFEPMPEPEKPREWLLHFAEQFQHIHDVNFTGCCGTGDYGRLIRVHDADACDRIHENCHWLHKEKK